MNSLKIYVLFIALIFVKSITAQNITLKGKVINEWGSPVEYITATLFDANGRAKAGTISDSLGFFSIDVDKGNYLFKLSYLNRLLFEKTLTLEQNLDLQEIKIGEQTSIEEVNVVGTAKLIERKIDRIVFNLANSSASTGLNGMEALNMVPLIDIQGEDNIKIVGKGQVSLMINGKLMQLSSEDIGSYLRTLRAENIDKVEIITAPPAKYDAIGNSGIINVILKKKNNYGWSATINNVFTQRKQSANSTNGTLNFQSGNFGLTAAIGYTYDKTRPYENFEIKNANNEFVLFQKNNRIDEKKDYNFSVKSNYSMSDKSTVWINYDYIPRHTNNNILSSANYPLETGRKTTITEVDRERNKEAHIANMSYELKLDSNNQKKISFDLNYLNNIQDEPNYFKLIDDENSFNASSLSNVRYSIWSGQSDLTLPSTFMDIETGIKYTHVSNQLEQTYTSSDEIYEPDGSNLKYKEHIYALYISGTKKIGKQIEISAGMRYENSQIDLHIDNQSRTKSGNLFPSLFISYTPTEDVAFSLSYTKRIYRPPFQYLSPYKLYTNSNQYQYGNPLLTPSLSHNLEFAYTRGNFMISAYWQRENNGFGSFYGIDSLGNNFNTFENFFNGNNYGLYSTYYFNISPWWNVQLTADLFYQEVKTFVSDNLDQNAMSLYYNVQNNFFLNKSKTLRINAGFWHRLPSVSESFQWGSSSNLSTTINYLMRNKKLQMNLGVFDILKTNRSTGTVSQPNFVRTFENYYDIRKITFGLTYFLGKSGIKTVRKKSNFEENNRAN